MSHDVLNAIHAGLSAKKAIALATIIRRSGSTPRSSGSRMVIDANGKTAGSVGGGRSEAQVIQRAQEILESGESLILDFQFSGKDAASMDMICGGQAQILLERIGSEGSNLYPVFQILCGSDYPRRELWWVQSIAADQSVSHSVFTQGKLLAGDCTLDPEEVNGVRQTAWLEKEPQGFMVEYLGQSGKVLLFGAGHVAQPLAHLCKLTGFEVLVFDDRPEFANAARFPDADRIEVPNKMETALDLMDIDDDTSIVIITRGHLQDQVILEQALKTRAGYIGMIGSRRKWILIKKDLAEKGYCPKEIERVHTPIGLQIGAETPAEIGISIVAELIQTRAERLQSPAYRGNSIKT